ncbi:hypothetical protein, conserved [Babesia ovata]|uniref:Extracellular matrix-binding ebh n=1 Tax=Babesia ovata TaxID=189622 RepID=A0A2H6KKA2_9APIC|nr:uncharacterized protein BOVATA_049170 [Babesia ovata]GBE63424.1 hypothetical protein, conserved [Babesia ovata]
MRHFIPFTSFMSPLIHPQSNYNNHYNEVHYLTEDARNRALKDIDARRISLGKLAGQLMGFIGGSEEVKNALVNGLHSNVNQLEKLLKTSCGDKGCCKYNDDVKNNLNDVNEKLKNHLKEEQKASKNLTEILSQCKLNDLDGPLKELKDAITEKIEKLNKDIESLKKADKDAKQRNETPQNASEIVKFNKDLQSHNASKRSLETLKELCGYAGKIQKNHENPKKLLESLCTGLEKFLGYQDGNYTGEGIVYSDLDRLCDGVMAFLHGVLSGVKDDESVTTYDKNNDINNVLEKLNDSVGKGRKAFEEAVTQVDTLTKNVTRPLGAIEKFKSSEYDAISGQLADWTDSVQMLPTLPKSSLKSLSALDGKLKNHLETNVCVILSSVNTFVESTKHSYDDLVAVASTVDRDLTGLENQVNVTVQHEVDILKRDMYDNIDTLQKYVKKVLEEKVDALKKTVEKLEKIRLKIERGANNINERFQEDSFTLGTDTVPGMATKALGIFTKACHIRDDKLGNLWAEIQAALTRLADEIAQHDGGPKSQNPGSLDRIVKSVGEYATDFKSTFESAIVTMVGNIMKREPVKHYTAAYVTSVKGRRIGDMDPMIAADVRNVVDAVQNNITTQLKQNSLQSPVSSENVESDLQAVKKYLHDFAAHAAAKLHSNVTTIVSSIEQDLRKKRVFVNPHAQLYLKRSVQSILTAVKTAADESEKEIGNFSTMSYIANLATAMKAVKDIGTKLQGLIEGPHINPIKCKMTDEVTKPAEKIKSTLAQIIEGVRLNIRALNDVAKTEPISGKQPEDNIKLCQNNLTNDARNLDTDVQRTLTNQCTVLKHTKFTPTVQACEHAIVNRVTAETADTKKSIKNDALTKFVMTKAKELNELKQLVTNELDKMITIIDTDLKTGMKGLMKTMKNSETNLAEIKSLVTSQPASDMNNAQKCQSFCNILKTYFTAIYNYFFGLLYPKHETIQSIHSALTTLLSHLSTQKHFTHEVPGMLAELKTSVQALTSTAFANPAYPVLDAFPKSLLPFVEQLERGYVNRYEGGDKITWEKEGSTSTVYSTHVSYNTELTEESQKGARVFLSIMDIISDAFSKMDYKCNGDWSSKKLCEKVNGDENPLGAFLKRCGFEVAKNETSKDGELHHESVWNGKKIHEDCLRAVQDATNNEHLKACVSKDSSIKVLDILSCLMTHLNQYNQVGHIATFTATRTPCSIFDILCWLSGLPHNAVFQKLTTHCSSYDTKGDTDLRKRLLDAVAYSFPNIGKYSHNMLTTIVGTGNADTIYGSDLANNSLKFKYPASGEECLSTLLDIMRRLLPVCRFLYKQCGVRPSHFGWRDCQYGKNIPTAKWPCTDHSTDKTNSQPTTKPTCQANTEPNRRPNCQPTSPLMSYLNDCLPGHLPHQLIDAGCKSSCSTCPSTSRNGMPCLTPLGFRAFSGSTKTGRDLCEIIKKFLIDVNLSSIFCLGPKPPVTLPEHFGFALSLVGQWADTSRTSPSHFMIRRQSL